MKQLILEKAFTTETIMLEDELQEISKEEIEFPSPEMRKNVGMD